MAHLYVIAGHGAGDSGATGGGYTEQERVRALAKVIKQRGGDNVTLGDLNKNYYASNEISKLNISKDWQIVELHMDSAAASARGAHVIINSTFNADKYDTALADRLTNIFPGRANKIVKRSDLANPKRAAAKGYPYRLVEVGFISNAEDREIFNTRMTEIADAILESFDIKPNGATSTTPAPAPTVDIDKLAREVIAGKYGNGDARKKALGANYDKVQARVNEILKGTTSKKSVDEIAREVIRGDWGNGQDRKNRLAAAGYDYNAVQARVNQLLQ